jgi:hypothetical protein
MNADADDGARRSDPLEALLADWLSGVILAAHRPRDIDSPDSYAHATADAMQARLAAERLAHEQMERLYAGLARRATQRSATRIALDGRRPMPPPFA